MSDTESAAGETMARGTLFRIDDFGAVPGKVCTDAIQRAVNAASEAGGTVYVPPGVWLTGSLELRSGMVLFLSPRAVLKGSPCVDDYRDFGRATEGSGRRFLCTIGQRDIVVTGGGVIDGSFEVFQAPPKEGLWYDCIAPRVCPMIEFRDCSHILLDNVRIQNSPGWTLEFCGCDHVTARGVTITNNLYGGNCDGIVIQGSSDVVVSGCSIVTGDDAIVMRSTTEGKAVERVRISDCAVETNCIGIGLHWHSRCGVRDIVVNNVVMQRCNRMFSLVSCDTGLVENVSVSNITGNTFVNNPHCMPIHLDFRHYYRGPRDPNVPLPVLRNVQISNLTARTTGRILLTAEQGTWLENIILRDILLDHPDLEDPEFLLPKTPGEGGNIYSNWNLEARKQRAALIAENVKNLVVDGLHVAWPAPDCPVLPMAVDKRWGRYRQDKQPWAGMWLRGIRGGYIHAPTLRGHRGGQPFVMSRVEDLIVEGCDHGKAAAAGGRQRASSHRRQGRRRAAR